VYRAFVRVARDRGDCQPATMRQERIIECSRCVGRVSKGSLEWVVLVVLAEAPWPKGPRHERSETFAEKSAVP
jgi:hypothetical protein